MGMDVFGKNPTSETGKYFRNNVWWWRPLADYILSEHPDIAAGCQLWHTNDGDGLNAEDSKRLADALVIDLTSGKVKTYVNERQVFLDSLPLEECEFCGGTGVRTDQVGVDLGMDVAGTCNGCDSTGKKPSFETWYGFNEENVQEFADFLADCGGFEIC